MVRLLTVRDCPRADRRAQSRRSAWRWLSSLGQNRAPYWVVLRCDRLAGLARELAARLTGAPAVTGNRQDRAALALAARTAAEVSPPDMNRVVGCSARSLEASCARLATICAGPGSPPIPRRRHQRIPASRPLHTRHSTG